LNRKALAIVAIIITAVASANLVGAVHTAEVSVNPRKVRSGELVIFDIKITNSPDSANGIVAVRITVPQGWSSPYPLVRIGKDNNVSVLASDNIVYLPAGTIVFLMGSDNIYLPENTALIVKENKWIYVPPVGNTQLLEDVEVRVGSGGIFTENVCFENFLVAKDLAIGYPTMKALVLGQDVLAIRTGQTTVRLPENTFLRTAGDMVVALPDNTVKSAENINAILKDNTVTLVTDKPQNLMGWVLPRGRSIQLLDNEVVIPAGSTIQLTRATVANIINIPDNTAVIRKKGQELDVTSAILENVPKEWSVTGATNYVEWAGGQIAPGSTATFKVALEITNAGGFYNLAVTTVDTANFARNWFIPIEVDNKPPVPIIEVSRRWVKGNEPVEIVLMCDEPFTFENAEIWENGMAPALLTLTPNHDRTEWRGIYTTENDAHYNNDGFVTVRVNSLRDNVGNEVAFVKFDNVVFIDRRRPPAPNLASIGLPAGIENKNRFVINTTLSDANDNLLFTPPGYTPEGIKLEILLDNEVVASGVADWTGLVSFELIIPDGKHTIAARLIDKAGNAGDLAMDNLIVDTHPPEITIRLFSISGDEISDIFTNENRLTIKVLFGDGVLGIENKMAWPDLFENENLYKGYFVVVRALENNDNITLAPVIYPDVDPFNSHIFENTICLPEGAYEIVAMAGDGYHKAAASARLNIDKTPPPPPTITTALYRETTKEQPYLARRSHYSISGAAEAGTIVRVLANLYNLKTGALVRSGIVLSVASTNAIGEWSTTFNISNYKGFVVEVVAEASDIAGNNSSRTLYGYLLYDNTPPLIEIEVRNIKTDRSSVILAGTIKIDDWEYYDSVFVVVSPAGASFYLDRTTGKFTISVPLVDGRNQVAITAMDAAGNSYSTAVLIEKMAGVLWELYVIILVLVVLALLAFYTIGRGRAGKRSR